MYAECQAGCLEWFAGEQPFEEKLGITSGTRPNAFVCRFAFQCVHYHSAHQLGFATRVSVEREPGKRRIPPKNRDASVCGATTYRRLLPKLRRHGSILKAVSKATVKCLDALQNELLRSAVLYKGGAPTMRV